MSQGHRSFMWFLYVPSLLPIHSELGSLPSDSKLQREFLFAQAAAKFSPEYKFHRALGLRQEKFLARNSGVGNGGSFQDLKPSKNRESLKTLVSRDQCGGSVSGAGEGVLAENAKSGNLSAFSAHFDHLATFRIFVQGQPIFGEAQMSKNACAKFCLYAPRRKRGQNEEKLCKIQQKLLKIDTFLGGGRNFLDK